MQLVFERGHPITLLWRHYRPTILQEERRPPLAGKLFDASLRPAAALCGGVTVLWGSHGRGHSWFILGEARFQDDEPFCKKLGCKRAFADAVQNVLSPVVSDGFRDVRARQQLWWQYALATNNRVIQEELTARGSVPDTSLQRRPA